MYDERILRIQNGDKEELDKLVGEYLPKVYKLVENLIWEADVDDVCQDIFLNLVTGIGTFRHESSFETWFNKLITNKAADYKRKNYRDKAKKEDFAKYISQRPPSVQRHWISETREILSDALPENMQCVIADHVLKGMNFYEIAELRGLSYEGARSRYRRAIRHAQRKIPRDALIF